MFVYNSELSAVRSQQSLLLNCSVHRVVCTLGTLRAYQRLKSSPPAPPLFLSDASLLVPICCCDDHKEHSLPYDELTTVLTGEAPLLLHLDALRIHHQTLWQEARIQTRCDMYTRRPEKWRSPALPRTVAAQTRRNSQFHAHRRSCVMMVHVLNCSAHVDFNFCSLTLETAMLSNSDLYIFFFFCPKYPAILYNITKRMLMVT